MRAQKGNLVRRHSCAYDPNVVFLRYKWLFILGRFWQGDIRHSLWSKVFWKRCQNRYMGYECWEGRYLGRSTIEKGRKSKTMGWYESDDKAAFKLSFVEKRSTWSWSISDIWLEWVIELGYALELAFKWTDTLTQWYEWYGSLTNEIWSLRYTSSRKSQ